MCSYVSPGPDGLCVITLLIRWGVAVKNVKAPTRISKNTSKKLFAVPEGANGGRSSLPVWVLAVSKICPRDGRVGCRRTSTGPSELFPVNCRSTISVCTSSRPFPSLSLASPSWAPSKNT